MNNTFQFLTSTVLMIRPRHFDFNSETAADNAFQQNGGGMSEAEIQQAALAEFDQMVQALESKGVKVIVVEDSNLPTKPDAIFPNNWFSTHADGTIITYPMLSKIRRQERREDIVKKLLKKNTSFQIHMEGLEKKEQFLEGTGSLVLDRRNKIAYATLSQRTHPEAVQHFCRLMDYESVVFNAVDQNKQPIYHTNVMMTVGSSFAIVALESITDIAQRKKLITSLEKTGKEIIKINIAQMNAFAGNMLQLQTTAEKSILVMSTQANQSLTSAQIGRIEKHTSILSIPLYTIEKYGGGSARCMMAEVF